jgi:hypothetical protein
MIIKILNLIFIHIIFLIKIATDVLKCVINIKELFYFII